ncbi:type II secretion system F family protein [Spongisporangium articulatum]|uniref:Type II secretion system F family protein n=1 Tax=Spongisporangium articulatum TaxID=3362603 RepID=A0ABW8AIX2_9ACTN
MPAPLLAELVAAVLQAGLPPETALHAVADGLAGAGDSRAALLRHAAAGLGTALPRGPEPGDEALAELVSALDLAVRAGVAPATLVRRSAQEQRRRAVVAEQRAVRRLEVWLVAPTGLCWLPAFVLTGVVPLVIDLFTR